MTASLMKLDLLSDKQVVEYTHFLLDNEYYDDEMLAILDDDPVYPNPQDYKKKLLRKALGHLGFPKVSRSQAKWLYSYYVIWNCVVQPENYFIFNFSELNIYENFYDFFDDDSLLQAVGELKDFLYCLDEAYDCLERAGIYEGYNDSKSLLAMKFKFFDLCQQWLVKNQQKIASIFANLYS